MSCHYLFVACALSWLWFSGSMDLQLSSRWDIFGCYMFKYLFPFSLLSLRDSNYLWVRPHKVALKVTEVIFIYSILFYLCVSLWIVCLLTSDLLIISSAISNLLYFFLSIIDLWLEDGFSSFLYLQISTYLFEHTECNYSILMSLPINSNMRVCCESISIDCLLYYGSFFPPHKPSNL